jgi:mannosyltransferase OCH1-like enzyme
MQKIIHYCWFGGKPLSKMAKKCIKSWKKYFPDYEIKEWNETNFDVNICPFVKQAYENKKWAFVSDYARLYALYNEGGIYFDTDMEVTKKCDFLCQDKLFLGYEENRIIAAGVLGVKTEKNKYIKQLLDWYDKQSGFDVNNVFNYAIPRIITNIFSQYNKENINGIDIINKEIKVYSEEYFYPINYNYSRKNFTENTCMIHYYNATWAPKQEKIAIFFLRTFGMKLGKVLLNIYYKICNIKNNIIWRIKSKIHNAKMFLSIHINYKKRVMNANEILSKYNDYAMIYHPDWIGLSHVAKDNFENIIPLREQHTEKEAKLMAKAISDKKIDLIIFNGFAKGWDNIAKELKRLNPKTIIKVLWHGSNALLTEDYDFQVFMQILRMHKQEIINELVFVKKSMYEFYKAKGYKCSFVMNYIDIPNVEQYKEQKKNDITKIGLYCSGDRWVKNTYNQLSAVSLIEDAVIDCLPLSYKVQELANQFNLSLTGSHTNLSREELFKRMAQNDINLYVTFTECAPLLPLESLELGVPCITGDNHHYFEGHELEKYLVVNKEDNIMEIYEKIKYALENKDKILELYEAWKKEYKEFAKDTINKITDK